MRRLVCLAVLLALALAGCGGGGQSAKQDKADKQVCDARADIGRRVRQLQDLTPATATVGGVQAQVDVIQDDLKDIAAARDDLGDERAAEVRTATDRFSARLTAIVGAATQSLSLSNAQARLERAAADLSAAYSSTLGRLDC
jgi:DNA-binding helix-hairpin-helix protein with protein kinase domain